jgi:hypothetical protein
MEVQISVDDFIVFLTDSRLFEVFTLAGRPGVREMSAQIVPLFFYILFDSEVPLLNELRGGMRFVC